ncbi:hypothetical protein E2C01_012214 [Portunus trituberculatus]|uniref:Uncharacterized protein n=1 Tax=Portunus trituberculatus TaxID=210409 RepID=A0A5B7DCX8_PORTR|nr:hypothetical protein [Portunus trituberculatus]
MNVDLHPGQPCVSGTLGRGVVVVQRDDALTQICVACAQPKCKYQSTIGVLCFALFLTTAARSAIESEAVSQLAPAR